MSSSEAATAKIGADEKNDVNNQQPAKPSTGISSGCATFIALLAVSLTIAGLGVVAGTSGTAIVKGVPRAAIVVFEGFKGTSFEELLALQKLPNIAYLAAQGKRSVCNSIDDARCARTQSGQFLGADFTWTSGPGIASILTGVNADKHQVKNDTFDDYAKFSVTSTTYPSLLAQARTSGFTTRAVGSSHLLTSPASSSPSAPCTQLGVADFECGADAVGRCLQTTSCNINTRKTIAPVTDFLGTEEQALDDAVAAAFSSNIADLLVIHSDKLSRIATDPAYPSASFSSSSQEYAAEAYVLDSVVGQLSLLIKQRVEKFQENWLVVLTSDHGGQDKTFGTHTDQDEVIPFIVATMTSNGNLALKELHTPTTQMDVAPTVLSWLGVVVPSNLDGVVQGICSSGVVPSDCVSS